jgi:hypothetical protein
MTDVTRVVHDIEWFPVRQSSYCAFSKGLRYENDFASRLVRGHVCLSLCAVLPYLLNIMELCAKSDHMIAVCSR